MTKRQRAKKIAEIGYALGFGTSFTGIAHRDLAETHYEGKKPHIIKLFGLLGRRLVLQPS